jgi:hypothetical protein
VFPNFAVRGTGLHPLRGHAHKDERALREEIARRADNPREASLEWNEYSGIREYVTFVARRPLRVN